MNQTIALADWRSIAEEASNEMDSAKLVGLVSQLCEVLDADDEKKSALRRPANLADVLTV